ncbi:tripartite tricarboxylate transporter TctB family protein [Halomonas elongata]|uniref:Tripartite tricarboxylate transporter TctB family protein n=1 Tax=Halomonas elongata TaxID=2746 RepID=A0A1B8P1S9_HALEL|nr:tripartite tricarboxylate transporter TctB family protein [Halomonas elongata]OBX36235.1 tripartite tricarboxylate transporter TctB family protein [Halomonas elongata]
MQAKVMLFAIATLLLAMVALVPTLQLPSAEEVSTFIGPRLWPLSLLIALLALGGGLLVTTWRNTRQGSAEDASHPTENEIPPARRLSLAATRHWWLMAATLAYTLLMQTIGFLPATIAFTLLCTWLLGARHWGAILATVAIAVVLIQGVFALLLGIPLP